MRVNSVVLMMVITFFTFGKPWHLRDTVTISNVIATNHGIGCIHIRHPSPKSFHTAYNLAKIINHNSANFRLLRVSSMDKISSEREWVGCPRVLSIILGWLPGAQLAFPQFSKNVLTVDPVWLIILAEEESPAAFIADSYLPYQVRVLTAIPAEGGIRLTEWWRAAWNYPLRMSAYGFWQGQSLICSRLVCSFHSRKDLEGAPIRASTKDDMPISGLERMEDGRFHITGYFGAVFHEIARQINCTPNIILSTDNMTGSEIRGTWNGLIGMMIRNETDLAVGPMSFHNKVLQVANFIPPLLRTHYQVFFKQAGTVVEWDAFLKPFGRYIWRVILIWFMIATFAYNYCYKAGCRLGLEDVTYTREFSKINSFFAFFRAFCLQGSDMTPKSIPCRGLHLTGYMTSAIMMTAYSASLISKLTLQVPLRPFDSLESFLSDGSYTLTAIARSTDYTYFSEATDPLLKNIFDKLVSNVPDKDLPHGKEEGMLQVCLQHKTALFITFAVSQLTAKDLTIDQHCPILWFRAPLGTVFLTIAIRKNMEYSRLIAHEYQVMMERGVASRLMKAEWPLRGKDDPEVQPPSVELKQVAQIYCILFTGAIVALLVLGLENLMTFPSFASTVKELARRSGCNEDSAVSMVLCFVAAIILASILANALE